MSVSLSFQKQTIFLLFSLNGFIQYLIHCHFKFRFRVWKSLKFSLGIYHFEGLLYIIHGINSIKIGEKEIIIIFDYSLALLSLHAYFLLFIEAIFSYWTSTKWFQVYGDSVFIVDLFDWRIFVHLSFKIHGECWKFTEVSLGIYHFTYFIEFILSRLVERK